MPVSVVIPQAQTVAQAVLVTSGSYSVSDTFGPFPVDFWTSAEVTVVCTVASGTLSVYVQKLLPDNVLWDDIAAFAVFSTTGAVTLSFINGGNTLNSQTNIGISANTVQTVAFGSHWRVRTVLSGAFSFGIFANFRA